MEVLATRSITRHGSESTQKYCFRCYMCADTRLTDELWGRVHCTLDGWTLTHTCGSIREVGLMLPNNSAGDVSKLWRRLSRILPPFPRHSPHHAPRTTLRDHCNAAPAADEVRQSPYSQLPKFSAEYMEHKHMSKYSFQHIVMIIKINLHLFSLVNERDER